ncbi:MAG TPA: methyl-accepting chemotaxis protein, partial [Burkholderiaceae bacterium]|nr:methyl-accepting chemotaxis protein [Burkholderiaceae bacterium]
MTSRLTTPFLTAPSEPARLGRGFALLLSMLAGVAGLGLYELNSLGERQQQQAVFDAQRSRQGQELLATVGQVGLLARQALLSAASPEGRIETKAETKADAKPDRAALARAPAAAPTATPQRLAEAQDRAAALELALRGSTAQAAPAWLAGQLDDLASARAQTLQLLAEAQRQARDGHSAEALHTLTGRAELAESRWRSLAEELVRQLDLHGVAAQKTAQEARQRQLLQFFAWSLTALLLGAVLAWNAVQRVREALQRNLRTVAGSASKAVPGARSGAGAASRSLAAEAALTSPGAGTARGTNAASAANGPASPSGRAAAVVTAPGSSLLQRREADRDWSALDRLAGALTRAGTAVHAAVGSGVPTKAALPVTPAANDIDLRAPLPTPVTAAPAAPTEAAGAVPTTLPPQGLPARPREELLRDAVAAASRGGLVVSQVVANIEDIGTTGRRIAEIIGVIDSIAFQTNLLALNAAVEAARAEARDAAP